MSLWAVCWSGGGTSKYDVFTKKVVNRNVDWFENVLYYFTSLELFEIIAQVSHSNISIDLSRQGNRGCLKYKVL